MTTIDQLPIDETYGYKVWDANKFCIGGFNDSDEYFNDDKPGWMKYFYARSDYPDQGSFPHPIHRRRIDVGAGYELVPLDDYLVQGDESAVSSGPFGKVFDLYRGLTVRELIKKCSTVVAVRRKVAAQGWIKLSERKPSFEGQEVLAYPPYAQDAQDGLSFSHTTYSERGNAWHRRFTHWMPAPPKPQPEPNPDDEAFEKFMQHNKGLDDVKLALWSAFSAGLAHARKESGK